MARREIFLLTIAATLAALSVSFGAEPRRDAESDSLPPAALRRLGTLRFRAGGIILGTMLSPDGKTLIVADKQEIRWFDATTGHEQQARHLGVPATLAAFNPEGRVLLTAPEYRNEDTGSELLVWDTATARLTRRLRGPEQHQPYSVVISEDGKVAALLGLGPDVTAGLGVTMRVWELGSFRERCTVPLGPSPLKLATLSHDGRLLASWDYRGAARNRIRTAGRLASTKNPKEILHIWDTETGEELKRLSSESEPWVNAAFAPDGKSLVARTGISSLLLVNLASGTEPRRLRGNGNQDGILRFTPDGKTLLTSSSTGLLQMWDVTSGERKRVSQGPTCPVRDFTFLPSGRIVAHGTQGNVARVWDVNDRMPDEEIREHRNAIVQLAFSPDGKRVFSLDSTGVLCTWDAKSGSREDQIRILESTREADPLLSNPETRRFALSTAALSPDGRYVVLRGRSAAIRVGGCQLCETRTGQEIATLDLDLLGNGIATFSANGNLVACSSNQIPGEKYEMHIWKTATGERVSELTISAGLLLAIAFEPGNKAVASVEWTLDRQNRGSVVRIWDTATHKERTKVPFADLNVHSATFSPDGKLLALGTHTGTLVLIDAATGHEVRRMGNAKQFNYSAPQFSPDGRTLTVGGRQGADSRPVVYLWDVATGKLQAELTGHRGDILVVAFSPNGEVLATGSEDTVVLLWDVRRAMSHPQPGKP